MLNALRQPLLGAPLAREDLFVSTPDARKVVPARVFGKFAEPARFGALDLREALLFQHIGSQFIE